MWRLGSLVCSLIHTDYRGDVIMPSDNFLLQVSFWPLNDFEVRYLKQYYIWVTCFNVVIAYVCDGVGENAMGKCAELVFAPRDASFSHDDLLLPSGFRIIPLDSKDASTPNSTLDLASTLEVGPAINRGEHSGHGTENSVTTITFQFAFEIHLLESTSAITRQYVRSIISSVQRVAIALSHCCLSSNASLRIHPGTPEAQTLARWICQIYR